jgi:hypothetical protein
VPFRSFRLQWNAATECNVMLPLAAFPMHYYPATDTMKSCRPVQPNLALEWKRSQWPNPALRGRMETPVGAIGSKCGLPVIRPELRGPEISRPAVFAECVGDLSPTEAGIRVGEQLMGVECPVWPFLVNFPA